MVAQLVLYQLMNPNLLEQSGQVRFVLMLRSFIPTYLMN